jgi:X-Pro dipeptidyl-peptidase
MNTRLQHAFCRITSFQQCVKLLAIVVATGCGMAVGVEPAKPIIEDGESQVVPRFEDPDMWIRHDLWVETEFDTDGDGKLDRMHVDVTRQRQTETEGLKVPVIYMTSPYFAGTGLSQGCPTVGGDNESLAPKAVVDWLNGRAAGYSTPTGDDKVVAKWSTGKVGMTGTSFNGTLALAAATTGVDGLEAIIPVAPNTSYYHYYRSNGLIRSPGGFVGEDIDVLFDFIHSGNPKRRDYCNCNVRDKEMRKGLDRVSGDYNKFWAGRDYLNDLEPVKAAVLMSHAFNDWNVMPEHSNRIYQALRAKGVPVQVFYHQGGHGGPPPMKLMNRWFTHYLRGVENGVEKDARAWIVREKDERTEPTAYEDYPNPKASPVKLFLNAGAPQYGQLTTTPGTKKIVETLTDNFSFSGSSLAQAEWTNHRIDVR